MDYYDESYLFDHFLDLNRHLSEVRPIFDRFCREHGFAYVDRRSVGRYPIVQVERPGPVCLKLRFELGLDAEGRRYLRFHPQLQHELSVGASLPDPDGYCRWEVIFDHRPFIEVPGVLESELERALALAESWDEAWLRRNGTSAEPLRRIKPQLEALGARYKLRIQEEGRGAVHLGPSPHLHLAIESRYATVADSRLLMTCRADGIRIFSGVPLPDAVAALEKFLSMGRGVGLLTLWQ